MSDPGNDENSDKNPVTGSFYAEFPEQDDSPFRPPQKHEPKPVKAKPMRRAAIVGARLVAGLAGLAVAAAAIAAAGLVPLPSIAAAPASTLVTPVATAQQLVCPGGFLRLASESGEGATTASSLGSAAVTTAATRGAVDVSPLPDSEAGTGGTGRAPQLLSTPPDEAEPGTPVLISGAQAQSVASAEFVGLAATSCTLASGDAWLSGGSTAVGRTTLITLSNPSEVAASVSLQIFGEKGPVVAPGMSGIVVAAQSQRVLSLAGFAPGLASPVVHVESRGGRVVATLQQTVVRGLEAGGADIIAPGSAPGLTNVIPGVVIAGSSALGSRLAGEGYEDLETALRLFVPGTASAVAQVTVMPENGAATGMSFEITAEAGRVTDFPLDDLADGSYAITVRTTVPVTVAARTSTSGSGSAAARTDFAWFSTAPELNGDSLVSIPTGVIGITPALHFVNPSQADAKVVLERMGGGDGLAVTVPAGSSALLAVPTGATFRLSGFPSLYSSVSVLSNGGIGGYPVSLPGRISTPILIYP